MPSALDVHWRNRGDCRRSLYYDELILMSTDVKRSRIIINLSRLSLNAIDRNDRKIDGGSSSLLRYSPLLRFRKRSSCCTVTRPTLPERFSFVRIRVNRWTVVFRGDFDNGRCSNGSYVSLPRTNPSCGFPEIKSEERTLICRLQRLGNLPFAVPRLEQGSSSLVIAQ